MITNIISIIDALKTERTAGDEMAADLVARIDAHINDLQTLRAWVIDSAAVRSQAIAGLLGAEVEEQPQLPAVVDTKEGEAA